MLGSIDEVGNRHGRWMVLGRAGSDKNGVAKWLCRCDCGTERTVLGAELRRGRSKSCGCRYRATIEKVWARVDKRGQDECWNWLGSCGGSGYGSVQWEGRSQTAHRAVWIIERGPIPGGLWVLHACDNRICCNPDHLFLGTPVDNMQDMKQKGRDKLPGWKPTLTASTVKEIRRLHKDGEQTTLELAQAHNVSPQCIHSVVTRKTWSHI